MQLVKMNQRPAKDLNVFVGKYSVFVDGPKGRLIQTFFTDEEARVTGVGVFRGSGVPQLAFNTMTSDLKVYQKGEVATVFVYWPEEARNTVTATIRHGGKRLREVEVQLDAYGVGSFTQDDLQVGEYSIRTKNWSLSTSFMVAEFTQSPLVASLSGTEFVSGKNKQTLRGVLTLSTFGTSLAEGTTVEVELKSRYIWSLSEEFPLTQEFVVGADGQVDFEFAMPERFYGELGMVVSDVERPSLTAEVAIPMARSSYSVQPSPFNTLGQTALDVAPVQSPGSVTYRGLHFTNGAAGNDPIEPVSLIDEAASFKVFMPIEELVFGVFNTTTGKVEEHRFEDVEVGSVITLPYEGIWAPVSVSAWVISRREEKTKPFEAVTNFMHPEQLALEINAPERVEPGKELNFTVKADGVEDGTVMIVIKSSPLQINGKPGEKLTQQLLDAIKLLGPFGEYVTRTPDELHDMMFRWYGAESLSLEAFGDGPMPAMAMASPGGEKGLESATSDEGEESSPEPREEQQITTLLAGVYSLKNGKAEISLVLPEAMADVSIDAFLATDGDWAAAETQQVLIMSDLFTKMSPPSHVAPGDKVLMTALVHSITSTATVDVTANGTQIPFMVNGELIPLDQEFQTPALLSFAVGGGDRIMVSTANEVTTDHVTAEIPILGKYSYDNLALKALLQGESCEVGTGGFKRIEVVPSMANIFQAIAEAIAKKKIHQYDCCGQTAAKLTVMVKAIVDGNAEMRWALFDGFDHMSSMYVQGQGFRFYPAHDRVASSDNYYATSAAIDLRSLQMWAEEPAVVGDREVKRVVDKLVAMGEDAYQAYGLAKKRKKITSMQQAYMVLSLEGNEKAAEKFLRSKLVESRGVVALQKHKWGWLRHSDLAYAAVIALQLGLKKEGYQLANSLFATFDRYMNPYGYIELLPVVLLLDELDKLDAESEIVVNGTSMTSRELLAFKHEIKSIEVVSGAAFVRITQTMEEDVFSRDVNVDVRANLVNPTGEIIRVGDKLKLVIEVANKHLGDVVAIMLSNSLAQLNGGSQVRTFERDLRWWREITIELVAVSDTRRSVDAPDVGEQTIGVLVRNMDDPNRIGLLTFKVSIQS